MRVGLARESGHRCPAGPCKSKTLFSRYPCTAFMACRWQRAACRSSPNDATRTRPPVDLETRQLRMLVAIADEGTVTRAASRLNVSQPALSHGLRTLERGVGVVLFSRRPRGLVPTEPGERLLRTARAVLR